jgi:phosphoribosylanthranilate isomerase
VKFSGPIRIKICCMSSADEIALAVKHGASALGFVSKMPSGAGVISDEEIERLVPLVPPGVASFLLTSCQDVDGIVEQQRRARANTLQLVDAMPLGAYRELRRRLPGVGIVQVIHVVGEQSIEEAVSVAPEVDALLLDSGNPTLAVKELGGTGRVHNWSLSRQIVEAVPVPVYLAGGLRDENVAEAITQVRPFGVDVCSGLRTDGRLHEQKLSAFVQAVRAVASL